MKSDIKKKHKTAKIDEGDISEQRRVEEQLQESEKKFRNLVESAPVGISITTAEGKIIEVNPTIMKIFGYSKKEFEKLPASTFYYDPKDREKFIEELLKKGRVSDFEAKFKRKDGSVFWGSITTTAQKTAYGETQFLNAFLDITERKRGEEQLRAASLYSRSLIEASLDPLVTISPDGKIMDVNKATELVTGVSREQLIGSDFSEYFTEPERAREGYQEVFTKGFVRDYPLAIRHTSGKVTEVLYNATVYKNEAGEVQGVFAAARDITERKRVEEALRESEEKFRKTAASARDAIIILDNDGNASYWNEAAEKMLGYSFEDVSGKDIHILLGPKRYHEAYKKGYAKFGTTGQGPVIDETLELWAVRKDGTEIPIELSVSAFMMKGKWNALGIMRDVTERKQAEEQLRKTRDELEIRVQERTAELTKAMELLKEQQKAFMEVAVPVVKVWNRVLLVPLIGVFDSARAQLTMETLLTEIEETQAKVAILDVSGIPIVDSLVAKHLIRTVSAVKLMGAECIVTGIRSRISQTIVQLGVDLSGITTRTTLAEGLKVALDMTDQKIVPK